MIPRAITIDVGNSSVSLGFWDGGHVRVVSVREPEAAAALVTEPAVVISVSPARLALLQRALDAHGRPAANELRRPPAGLSSSLPELLASAGADRLANALGLLPGPGIAVDAGTAVTIDVVDGEGCYRGGFIAAGPAAAAAGLSASTALLPKLAGARVPLELGTETRGALGAGLWGSAVGGVDRLVSHAREVIGGGGPIRVLATGGWGAAWAQDSLHRDIEVVPELLHRGMARWAGWV